MEGDPGKLEVEQGDDGMLLPALIGPATGTSASDGRKEELNMRCRLDTGDECVDEGVASAVEGAVGVDEGDASCGAGAGCMLPSGTAMACGSDVGMAAAGMIGWAGNSCACAVAATH